MNEFDKAVEIAKEKNPLFNKAQEYNDAWLFFYDDGEEHDGGENGAFVVMKETYEIYHAYEYFMGNFSKCIDIGEEMEI